VSTPAAPRLVADVNSMTAQAFRERLGGVFEHSPWIAERAFARRPFADVAALHAAMVDVVRAASPDEQLALLRAHPELGGSQARSGALTAASSAEQKSAGLTALEPDDSARLARLNAAYRNRFGFPFIIAVRNHDRDGIFAELERRLAHDAATEWQACLEQVFAITRLRLDSMFED
jgi:2-oxo-4-hydroxy-4-carboxy-5-ureidoimidazoline decarboxylase